MFELNSQHSAAELWPCSQMVPDEPKHTAGQHFEGLDSLARIVGETAELFLKLAMAGKSI